MGFNLNDISRHHINYASLWPTLNGADVAIGEPPDTRRWAMPISFPHSPYSVLQYNSYRVPCNGIFIPQDKSLIYMCVRFPVKSRGSGRPPQIHCIVNKYFIAACYKYSCVQVHICCLLPSLMDTACRLIVKNAIFFNWLNTRCQALF